MRNLFKLSNRILTKEIFLKNIKEFKKKKIVLCHGAFDIVHIGHINHFKEAKKFGDILIVSLTDDLYIRKGPNQPYFNSIERANFLLNLKLVDFIYISPTETGEDPLTLFKPSYYVKGVDYSNQKKDINLKKEKLICKKYKTKILFTSSFKYSSTKIYNNKYANLNKEAKFFIEKILKKYTTNDILKIFDRLNDKIFCLSGEPIIDEFRFVEVIGTATKSPIVTSNLISNELHAGGTLAAANMLSNFVKNLKYFCPSNKSYLQNKIKLDKKIKFFSSNLDFSVPTKSRYVTKIRNNYLFQNNLIKYFNPKKSLYNNFIKSLNKHKEKHPLLILDFGLGLFDKDLLKRKLTSKNLYLNVQSNSNNYGFNLFSKYKKYSYLSVNLKELELNFSEKFGNISKLKTISKKIGSFPISITLGNYGSVFINKNKKFIYCPNFFPDATDTIGCGDAYFIITSLLVSEAIDDELVPFLGNLYAGLHSKNFGNSKFPTKKELIKTLESLLNV
tara:strand:+ start:13047 stop:14555 length:1509 start_codon:yes stop_codon:yes gene_type:complete